MKKKLSINGYFVFKFLSNCEFFSFNLFQSKVRVLQKQVITLGRENKEKRGKDTESPQRL